MVSPQQLMINDGKSTAAHDKCGECLNQNKGKQLMINDGKSTAAHDNNGKSLQCSALTKQR